MLVATAVPRGAPSSPCRVPVPVPGTSPTPAPAPRAPWSQPCLQLASRAHCWLPREENKQSLQLTRGTESFACWGWTRLAGALPAPQSSNTSARRLHFFLAFILFFFSTSISLVESFGRRRRVRNPPPALPGGPVTSRARCVAAGGVSSPCASGCSGSPMSCGHPKPSPGLVWVCGCVPQRPALLFAPSRSPGNVPTLLLAFPLAVFTAPSPKAVALRPPGKEQPNPALPLLLPVIPMALTPSHLWFFLQHLLGAEQEPGRALGLPCMKDRGGGRRRPPPASALETRCVGSLPLL